MKKIALNIIAFTLMLTLLITVTYRAARVYMPERENYGSTWDMYLCEDKNSIDIMFFGSSLAYCDIIPAVIWEKTDRTAYVMAGPSQVIPATYYYVREALKTQTPELVFIEITGLFYPKYTEFSNVNIGYMPFSLNRIAATFASAESSERLGLLFPMYNYHQEWENTNLQEYFLRHENKTDIFAGYTYLTEAMQLTERGERTAFTENFDEQVFNENLKYIEKTVNYCLKKGVKVQLYITPTASYIPHKQMDRLKNAIKGFNNTGFVDFNDTFDELNISLETDFYDTLHLNFRGALKFSEYISNFIEKNYTLNKHNRDDNIWAQRLDHINMLKKDIS